MDASAYFGKTTFKKCSFSQCRIIKPSIKCKREIVFEFLQAVPHPFHLHHRSKIFSNSSTVKRFLPPAFPYATATTASLRLHSIKTQAFTVRSTWRAQHVPTIVEFSWEKYSDGWLVRASDSNAVRVLFNKPVSSRARERVAHTNVCPKNMNSFVVLSVASHFLSFSRIVCTTQWLRMVMRSCPNRKESSVDSVHANTFFQFTPALHSERSSVRYRKSFEVNHGVRSYFILFRLIKWTDEYCEWDTSKSERTK